VVRLRTQGASIEQSIDAKSILSNHLSNLKLHELKTNPRRP